MSPGLRSGLTLLTLSVLVGAAALWGWSALTEPFPTKEELPVCQDAEVTAGTKVSRDQVVVSVFNGSDRNGLASTTMDLLVERDFVPGETGNAPDATDLTLILSSDPDNPAVRLVARQFPGSKITPGEALGPGVVVVVGQGFEELGKQVKSVKAKADATFCKATGSAG